MSRAFIFPGQGSQAVGMGKALADAFAPAREVFQEVDDALNQKLSRLMWEGPEDQLVLTLEEAVGVEFRGICTPEFGVVMDGYIGDLHVIAFLETVWTKYGVLKNLANIGMDSQSALCLLEGVE